MSSGAVIRAELKSSKRCETLGITAGDSAPAYLCRALVEAGHNRRRPLQVFRGRVLALVVRSIGDGPQLRIATLGAGFERIPGCTGDPPLRPNALSQVRKRLKRRSLSTPPVRGSGTDWMKSPETK